jgi:hypothetical protein
MRPRVVLVSVILLVPACGGGVGGDDPGTGTGTLFVDADIEASPEVPNAARAADFSTSFEVRITRDGVDVTTGAVTIDSDGGGVALVFDATDSRWHGDQIGYHGGYALAVAADADTVDGVVLNGPGFHTFTSPASGATVDAAVDLEVRWDRGATATRAELGTRETDRITIDDTGSYTVPALALRHAPDQVEEEELELRRSTRIAPAGAVAGSELRVEVRNSIAILVAACPACP